RNKVHDFRHSHASFLISKNVPIVVISKRLGHSNITETLNTYTHMFPNDQFKSIIPLNEINCD
ncbi:MAG: tyrosine-type recombinase/integrase, partial [Clostridia bacterium]|nr:tyrosine-type recombinase/integrase [Clostridia bacterium]